MLPEQLHNELFGTEQQRLERCTAFQNIILDHWKAIPQSMRKEISKVWSGTDRAIFNRCVLRKEK